MEEPLFNEVIVLYLLRYSAHLRNSYNIMKVLSRKFKIIEFGEISGTLIKKKYIHKNVINQMGHYSITASGELFLLDNLTEFLQELRIKYLPNDPEYIQLIISSSDK